MQPCGCLLRRHFRYYHRSYTIDILHIARRIVELAEDKQAHDIMLLDIGDISSIADYFVICSGDNERQLRAIIEQIDEQIEKEHGLHARIEGASTTGWILLDYGDIVVHVFGQEQRAFYQLERLWEKATPLVVMQ